MLRNKKGAAMVWAIIFGLVIFSAISLILSMVMSSGSATRGAMKQSQQRADLDQIGEYFVRAVEVSGSFPQGRFTKYSDATPYSNWMDEEARLFFANCNTKYEYAYYTYNSYGRKDFYTFYDSSAFYRELVVKKNGTEVLHVLVAERATYDSDGNVLTKESNPVTTLEIVEWTGNASDTHGSLAPDDSSLTEKINTWHANLLHGNETPMPNVYLVSYNANGGSCDVSLQSYTEGNAPISLPTPTKTYYEFAGWLFNGKTYNGGASFTPDRDISFLAQWKDIPGVTPYTVTFDANGGSCDRTSDTGVNIGLPTATREGYTFIGWYLDDTKIESPYAPSKNVTLVAKWKTAYVVTFDANGGECDTKTASDESIVLPTPTRSGFDFVGWYLGDTKIESPYTPTAHVTLVAKWKEIFTVKFDANGGTCDPTSASGENITAPTPTRSNYTFLGWYLGDTKVVFPFTPTSNVTITAKWNKKRTITFDANGGTCKTTKSTTGSLTTLPTATRGGYKFVGWYLDGKQITVPYLPTKNVTLVAQWEIATITFDSNGGSAVASVQGSQTSLPKPTRSGYSFSGWYIGSKKITASAETPYAPVSDVTLTAKWTIKYTVYYNANGGTCATTSKGHTKGSAITLPTATRDGYEFLGWYYKDTDTLAQSTDKVTAKTYLVARWNQIYTVTFNANGGSCSPTSGSGVSGTQVSLPTPTRSGFVFDGWYNGSTKVESPYTITAATTLTAKWNEIYKVTFNANGGTCSTTSASGVSGTKVTLPTPTKSGYLFAGWYNGSTKVDSNYTITATLTLTAKWSDLFTITFNAEGEYVSPWTENKSLQRSGTLIDYTGHAVSELIPIIPNVELIVQGISSVGTNTLWLDYKQDKTYNDYWGGTGTNVTTVNGRIVYKRTLEASKVASACYIRVNTIKDVGYQYVKVWQNGTLIFDGSLFTSAVCDVTSAKGTITTLPTPTKSGYEFLGWYNGTTLVTAPFTPTANVTLTAKWKRIPTVTFNPNGGTCSKVCEKSSVISSLPTPTRSGYTFEGWYDGSTKVTAPYTPSASVTLTAKWKAIPIVTYNANGGSCSKTSDQAVTVSSFPIPTRNGYEFLGWFNGSTQVTAPYTPTASITLTAKWKGNTYSITDSATGSSTTYTVSDSAQTATVTPTRFGYTFSSFKVTTNSSPASTVNGTSISIPANAYGNIVLQSNWTANKYTITVYNGYDGGVVQTLTYSFSTSAQTVSITEEPSRSKYTCTGFEVDDKYSSLSITINEADIKIPANTASDFAVKATWEESCLAEGTIISMADGTKKPIEEIKIGDMVLTYSLFDGKITANPIASIEHISLGTRTNFEVVLESGKTITLVTCHSLFDMTSRKYITIDEENYLDFIGTKIMATENGEIVADTIVAINVSTVECACYSIISGVDFNVISNDIISTNPFITDITFFEVNENYVYDKEAMARDIEEYGLSDYSEWSDVMSYEVYYLTNIQYINIASKNSDYSREEILNWLFNANKDNVSNIIG